MDDDCISRFAGQMIEAGYITDEEYKALDKEMKAEIKDAVEFAKNSPWPPLDELTNHVYA